jgi:uncharacterized protein (DUF2237 family)
VTELREVVMHVSWLLRVAPVAALALGGCWSEGRAGAEPDGLGSATCDAGPGACVTAEAPASATPSAAPVSVTGAPLATCSLSPRTGWFRDGSCRTDDADRGRHVVCAELTDRFLDYTRARGNDLSTPVPEARFPGLKAGDRWCLCADRWEEARLEGMAPPVVLEATDRAALASVPLETLRAFQITDRGPPPK